MTEKIISRAVVFCIVSGIIGLSLWFAIWAWRGALTAMGMM